MSEKSTILQEFVVEAKGNLQDIEKNLRELKNLGKNFDVAIANNISRAIHSISGTAGFYQLDSIKLLMQAWERAFNKIHSKQLAPSAKNITIMRKPIRKLKEAFKDMETLMDMGFSEEIDILEVFSAKNIKHAKEVAQFAVADITGSQAYMIVSGCKDKYFSFLIKDVERVARICTSDIEVSEAAFYYNGMRLNFIDKIASYEKEVISIHGVVFKNKDGKLEALAVKDIIDICYWQGEIKAKSSFSGSIGSANIGSYATTLIDVPRVCEEALSLKV